VYQNFYHVGVAIGASGTDRPGHPERGQARVCGDRGAILDFVGKISENRVGLSELEGGTFTITNGGVYGSLLSTPILNPPQSAILGCTK